MILVVADTSPLNYLVQISCAELLPELYDHILVPRAVFEELTHPSTPAVVRDWLASQPNWLEVRTVQEPRSSVRARLGAGEAEAIQLAQQEHADLLLIDERKGASLAQQQGLEVTGTLGVLLQAAHRQLVVLDDALLRLQSTDFRSTSQLFEQVRRGFAEFDQ